MTKLSELTKLFQEFDGDLKDQFIKEYPEIWNDCYDIMEGSRYHNAMLGCLKAGFDAATSLHTAEAKTEIDKLKAENENLKKIIAKELSENDEFGAEFVHVNILKEKLKIAVDDLKKLEEENSELLKQLNKIQEAITVAVNFQG